MNALPRARSKPAVHDQPEAEQVAQLALAATDLRRVEDVLAQHLRAELRRREGENGDADEREQEMLHVRRSDEPRAHALAEERADAAEHILDRAFFKENLRIHLKRFVQKELGTKPVIVTTIVEV